MSSTHICRIKDVVEIHTLHTNLTLLVTAQLNALPGFIREDFVAKNGVTIVEWLPATGKFRARHEGGYNDVESMSAEEALKLLLEKDPYVWVLDRRFCVRRMPASAKIEETVYYTSEQDALKDAILECDAHMVELRRRQLELFTQEGLWVRKNTAD